MEIQQFNPRVRLEDLSRNYLGKKTFILQEILHFYVAHQGQYHIRPELPDTAGVG